MLNISRFCVAHSLFPCAGQSGDGSNERIGWSEGSAPWRNSGQLQVSPTWKIFALELSMLHRLPSVWAVVWCTWPERVCLRTSTHTSFGLQPDQSAHSSGSQWYSVTGTNFALRPFACVHAHIWACIHMYRPEEGKKDVDGTKSASCEVYMRQDVMRVIPHPHAPQLTIPLNTCYWRHNITKCRTPQYTLNMYH